MRRLFCYLSLSFFSIIAATKTTTFTNKGAQASRASNNPSAFIASPSSTAARRLAKMVPHEKTHSISCSSIKLKKEEHDDDGDCSLTLEAAQEENNIKVVESWIKHSSTSYHDISSTKAKAIRKSLLIWYFANRRKLPWRGDAPPFDGSTAGIATSSASSAVSKSKKRKIKEEEGQKKLNSYFQVAPSQKKKRTTNHKKEDKKDVQVMEVKKEEDNSELNGEALPVTGYGVWVSEIMLQQTRVEAVIPYYLKWMKSFPTVAALASATEEDVNAHWAGLGFYRRARLLHAGAKMVMENYNGEVPKTVDELLKINGIGRYTASAVASIAYNVSVPVVDGNVCRVLSRLVGVSNHIKAPIFKDDLGWKLAEQIVCAENDGHAGDVNQALMELGATYCAPSGSGIDEDDPLKEFYMSTRIGRGVVEAIMKMEHEDEGESIVDADNLMSRLFDYEDGHDEEKCRLCHSDGVSSVVSQIGQDWMDHVKNECGETSFSSAIQQRKKRTLSKKEMNIAAKIGHAALPTPPPKKAKKEEVLAVAAISWSAPETVDKVTAKKKRKRTNVKENIVDRWLMVKRPNAGLLAGQWEFPSVCVWESSGGGGSSSNNKKQKNGTNENKKVTIKNGQVVVPFIKPLERRRSLQTFLENITVLPLQDDNNNNDDDDYMHILRLYNATCKCKRKNLEGVSAKDKSTPMEHIFSHVRHTMWVEHAHIDMDENENELAFDMDFSPSSLSWKTKDGREVRWMSELDMKNVGVTSGVKKVLSAVLKKRK